MGMGQFIVEADLAPFATIDAAKATEMVADAEAQAILIAPCLPGLLTVPVDETVAALALRTAKLAAVKSILRGAILRWDEAGTGAVQTEVTGPFSKTTQYQARRGMFWPSELTQLQDICKDTAASKIYSVDTVPYTTAHAPWCDLMLGGTTCSCGADIAGYPIYGV